MTREFRRGRFKKVGNEYFRLNFSRAAIVCLLMLIVLISAQSITAAPNSQVTEDDITREGTVQASTTALGFPASLAVDGDPTTSWFSTGPEPGGVPTRFQWTHPRDDMITTIYIHSNGQNKTPAFRTNYGFASVNVQVLNAANQVVFQQSVSLPGTPDPDVLLHPNVVGRTVLLLYSGHEALDCGGFSELQIKADRPPPPAPAFTAKIDVNKSQVRIGEPYEVCYSISTPADIELTVIYEDGTSVAVVNARDNGQGRCFPSDGAIVPLGKRTIRLKATANGRVVTSEISLVVLPAGTPSSTLPPPSATVTVALPTASPTNTPAPTLVALNPIPTASSSGLQGDCDGDGKITESDALCALEMSTQLRPPKLNMDMDSSGDVSSRDAVIILQRALGK